MSTKTSGVLSGSRKFAGLHVMLFVLAGCLLLSAALPVRVAATPFEQRPVGEAAQGGAASAMFRGDAARTGREPGPGPDGSPTVAWSYATGDDVLSSPVIGDDIVFVGSNDNVLYALDAGDGSVVWRFDTGNDVASSPAWSAGTVYVGSHSGIFYALDAADGSIRWEFTARSAIFPSPVIAVGTLSTR